MISTDKAAGAAKEKALESALLQIEKQFGKGTIMKLGEAPPLAESDVTPTGSIGLDIALGVGGIPRGRVVEIYGPEASGKTTLALHIMAEAQKRGGVIAMVDAEHAMDPAYAKNLGLNTDELLISQPDSGEQALEIVETLVRSSAVDVITVDSVAALLPRAELEGDIGDSHVGIQARLMSQALRKLTGAISKSRSIVIFINQLREKIGGMSFMGPHETTSGGRALKYYASIRLDVRRIEQIKGAGNEVLGNRTRVKIVKNKVAPPFRTAEFDIVFGRGIQKAADILDTAVQWGLVSKSGAFYSCGDTRIGQGRDNARAFLEDHPALLSELESKIKEKAFAKENPPEKDKDNHDRGAKKK